MTRNRKFQLKHIIIITLVVFLVAFVIYVIIQNNKAFDDMKTDTFVFNEDSAIIKNTYWKYITTEQVINSKTRASFYRLNYKDSFDMLLYHLPVESDETLKKIVQVDTGRANLSSGFSYSSFNSGIFNVKYKYPADRNVSSIYLNVDGDSLLQNFEGDSICIISSVAKNISLSYNSDNTTDILLTVFERPLNTPTTFNISVVFMQHKNKFYMLTFTEKHKKSTPAMEVIKNMLLN